MHVDSRTPAILAVIQGLVAILLVSNFAFAAGLHEEDVELPTPSGTLRGTLAFAGSLPPMTDSGRLSVGTPRPPVVLMIAGSGPMDRNGNGPGLHPDNLRQLAHALAGAGHAVVRYDKRGVGGSRAALRSESEIGFTDYVEDAVRWSDRLARDPRFSGVVLLGHSEGALIGALASARVHPRGFVSIGGVSAPAGEILRRQLRGRLPPDLASRSEEILRGLERGQTTSAVPDPLLVLYRPSVQPYLISWFRVRPTEAYALLAGVPTLIVQGETDLQVGVGDARELHQVLAGSTLAVVPGMNHVFKTVSGDAAAQTISYADPSSPLSRALVTSIDGFLGRLPANGPSSAASSSR